MWRHTPSLRRWLLILPLALALCVSACSETTTSPGLSEGPGGTPTASTSATPVASTTGSPGTSGSFADCAHAPGFSSAGSADAGSSFPDVQFPDGSVSVAQSPFTDTYKFQIVKVCTDSTTASAVRSFFASGLPSDGWTQVSHYPYHGDPTSGCGDPYCWRMAGGPVRYVSLEAVSTNGSVALYSLRLAIAPSSLSTQLTKHSKSTSASSGTLTVSASCASGEQMLSGGYSISNTNKINTAFSNYPSNSNTWKASLTLNVTVSTTLTATVLCLKANFLLHSQIVHNSASVAGGTTVPATVACPSGTVVTGGGFTATPNGYTFVVGSTPGPSGWGMATRLGSGTSINETVYAVCAHNLGGPTLKNTSVSVGASSSASILPICTGGTLRTGGGFSNSDPSGDANNFIDESGPASSNAEWAVGMYNRDSTSAHGAVGWAVCDTANPVY